MKNEYFLTRESIAINFGGLMRQITGYRLYRKDGRISVPLAIHKQYEGEAMKWTGKWCVTDLATGRFFVTGFRTKADAFDAMKMYAAFSWKIVKKYGLKP